MTSRLFFMTMYHKHHPTISNMVFPQYHESNTEYDSIDKTRSIDPPPTIIESYVSH